MNRSESFVKARGMYGVGPIAEVVSSRGIELGVVRTQMHIVALLSFTHQGANLAEDPLLGPRLEGTSTCHLLIGDAGTDQGELPRFETFYGRFVETPHLVAVLPPAEEVLPFPARPLGAGALVVCTFFHK